MTAEKARVTMVIGSVSKNGDGPDDGIHHAEQDPARTNVEGVSIDHTVHPVGRKPQPKATSAARMRKPSIAPPVCFAPLAVSR